MADYKENILNSTHSKTSFLSALITSATHGIMSYAEQIFDYHHANSDGTTGKFQSDINDELYDEVSSVKSRVTTNESSISTLKSDVSNCITKSDTLLIINGTSYTQGKNVTIEGGTSIVALDDSDIYYLTEDFQIDDNSDSNGDG